MMKSRSLLLAIVCVSAFAAASSASALTLDVCVDAATGARFDSTKSFFTGTAPIYPEGTIAQSNTPIDCTKISTTPIGTFFTVGGIIAGLPASAADDLAIVTWHFRLAKGSFDTIGPVEDAGPPHTGATPGQQYPQTIVGATHGVTAGNGEAIVTALDPSGFAFQIKAPGANSKPGAPQ